MTLQLHLGDAIVAAQDETRALSLLEQEISVQSKRVGLNVSNIKIRIIGRVEDSTFTADKEGVIYTTSILTI